MRWVDEPAPPPSTTGCRAAIPKGRHSEKLLPTVTLGFRELGYRNWEFGYRNYLPMSEWRPFGMAAPTATTVGRWHYHRPGGLSPWSWYLRRPDILLAAVTFFYIIVQFFVKTTVLLVKIPLRHLSDKSQSSNINGQLLWVERLKLRSLAGVSIKLMYMWVSTLNVRVYFM
jgi:hypothetical protein